MNHHWEAAPVKGLRTSTVLAGGGGMACVYVCMCMCVYVYICMCVYVCVRMCFNTNIT